MPPASSGSLHWAARAAVLVERVQDAPHLYDEISAEHLGLVNERLDAEGLRGKVWAAMPYQCDRCASVRWYEAEVGVEGPPSWREEQTFIASAFMAGSCDRCGTAMRHLMHRDEEFGPREPGGKIVGMGGLGVYADKMFRVPREPVRYTTHGVDDDGNVIYQTGTHAFLSIPMHAIRRATR